MFSRDDLSRLLEAVKTQPSKELESEVVEFKAFGSVQALHNSKELAEEVVALANLKGGLVVVGVRDSSDVAHGSWAEQLVGFPHCDLIEVNDRIRGRLRPPLELRLEAIEYEGKSYLVIEVPRRRDSLVATTSGKVFVRDGRSSRPMSPAEIETAVKGLQAYDWSAEDLDLDVPGALDPVSLTNAQEYYETRRGIAEHLDLTTFLESSGATRNGMLTKGGLLFLGRAEDIRKHLGLFEYRFTWKGPAGLLVINDVWTGNIWLAVERAKTHFDKCNLTHAFEFQGATYEVPALDPVAFHEAYLNALVHRDYSHDGMVSVTYSEDRMVVSSPGGFYGGVTAENIALHEPRHRNKALAQVLMLYNMVDRAGMGVLRMGLHSLSYGRSFPAFSEAFDSVQVSMQAEFLRPGIFVLTRRAPNEFSLSDLVIVNDVFGVGYAAVSKVEAQLRKVVPDPWQEIRHCVDRHQFVELCGDRRGVYLRVTGEWLPVLDVSRHYRASPASKKFVALYTYLKQLQEASNSDISQLLGHKYPSQTSKFLRDTKFVKRSGTGPSSRWTLL